MRVWRTRKRGHLGKFLKSEFFLKIMMTDLSALEIIMSQMSCLILLACVSFCFIMK